MVDATNWQSANQEDTTSPVGVEEVTRETARHVSLPVYLVTEDVILEQVALSTRWVKTLILDSTFQVMLGVTPSLCLARSMFNAHLISLATDRNNMHLPKGPCRRWDPMRSCDG